jgi:alpha-1,6-mannosyltransferase
MLIHNSGYIQPSLTTLIPTTTQLQPPKTQNPKLLLLSSSHIAQRYTTAALLAGGVYLLLLGGMAYGVARHQTALLLTGWALLFGLYLLLVWGAKQGPLWPLLAVAVAARLLLLPSIPLLSDDFYRFIWDGRLLLAGWHPFAHPPVWYMQPDAPAIAGIQEGLFAALNSKEYFTVYPPLCQALFAAAAWMGGDSLRLSVGVLRLALIMAEGGSIWLLLQLLKQFGKPSRHVLLYALNPLVVLELSGNLHFEALAVFFLLLLLWALVRRKENASRGGSTDQLALSALAFAGAVASKLWPLMLGPLLVNWLGWKKGLVWGLGAGLVCLLLFAPLVGSAWLGGMQESLALYYQRFEFNASLYYLMREIGSWWRGYNPIAQLGPLLALLATAGILWLSLRPAARRLPLPLSMLLIYSLFLLCSTTVHPWYVVPLLALMPLTSLRFPLIWSGLIFLTYAGYSPAGYEEPLLLVALEYGLTGGWLLLELRGWWLRSPSKPAFAEH